MATAPTVTAPVASAPSAPASTAPASSTPTPVSTPVSITPPAETGAPVAAAPAVVAAPSSAEPKSSDFANSPEGQTAFMDAHQAWDREQDAGEAVEPVAAEAETPAVEVSAPADQAKPAEETAPAVTEEAEPEEPAPVTPEVVNSWLEKNPALKAALDQDPVARRQMFAMARTNTKAQGLLEIFPTTEAGKFANEKANRHVALTRGFLHAADNPEAFPAAMENFASEFMVKGADGKPVMDAQGNPTFGKDFEMLANGFVDGYLDDEIADMEKLVETSEDDKDSIALSALRFVKELKETRASGKGQAPSTENLTPEQKAWQQRQQAEFDAERQRLGLTAKTLSGEEKKAQHTAWDKGCRTKIGASVGRTMDQFLADKAKAGVYIPSYVLDVKDPIDGQSMFVKNVFNEFNKAVTGVAHINDKLLAFEHADPTPANETARVEFYNSLVADMMPAIMEKRFQAVKKQDIADRKKAHGDLAKKQEATNVEPQGGVAVGGGGAVLSDEAAMAKAYETVDAKFSGLNRAQRTEKALNEFNRMATAR